MGGGGGLIAVAGIWEIYNIYDDWNDLDPVRDKVKNSLITKDWV
jgi:hypothetical protein